MVWQIPPKDGGNLNRKKLSIGVSRKGAARAGLFNIQLCMAYKVMLL